MSDTTMTNFLVRTTPRRKAAAAGSATTDLTAAPGARSFRPDIQGLRAIAVLLVVLYHAGVPGITGGYVGVDVFFVISGFLITGQLMRQIETKGRLSLLEFYGARMRRLLPVAAVVVVLTLIGARLVDSVLHVRTVALDALFTSIYAANYRFAAEGIDYQNVNGPESPLLHMWSLAVEEQFYIVWPLLLAACTLVAVRYRKKVIAVVLTLVVAASLAASILLTDPSPSYSYFGLHTRAWELGAGALIALAATRLTRLPRLLVMLGSWAGVVMIFTAAFTFDEKTAFPGTAALLPIVGAVLVIGLGCGSRVEGSAEALLSLRPMQGIGNVSYGFYLWHWPMLILIPLAAGRDLTWPYQVEIVLLSLWFAVLTYYMIEKPSQRSALSKTRWLGRGVILAAVTALVAALTIASLPSLVGRGGTASAIPLEKADTSQVQVAIIGGTMIREAPSNLRPDVNNAIGDRPRSSMDGCHLDYLVTTQGDCVYGDPNGKHTMVLFGDSHAQQWLPALDAEAKRQGWKVVAWTKAACSIANVQLQDEMLGREFHECDTWRAATVKRIVALNPDVVMATQSDLVPGTQVTNTSWGDSTFETLSAFLEAKIPVAYLMDTPVPQSKIPDCVAAHLNDVGVCNTPRTRAWKYDGRHESLAAAMKSAKVTTVEPIDWICAPSSCPAVVGDMLVYRDASHITATYSEWLSPMMAPLFVEKKER